MKFPTFQPPPITDFVLDSLNQNDFYNKYNKNIDIDYFEVKAKDLNLLNYLSKNHFNVGNFIPRKKPNANFTQVCCNPFYVNVESRYKQELAQAIVNHS